MNVAITTAQHARDWVDYAGIGLTFIGVVVVGLYTYYAKHQRDEAREANKLAKDALEQTRQSLIYGRRSWLIPEVDELSPVKGESGWEVAFYISNTGSVPGVMISAYAKVDTDPEFQRSHPQMFAARGAIILPGSVGEKGGLRVTADVPAGIPEEQLLATAGAGISVLCSIKYKDVFSDEWKTEVAWTHGRKRRWYNNPFYESSFK